MARKRKNDLDSWNRSLGYSDEALKALSSGTYDQLTGRDPKYRTSKEQTYANTSSVVPALNGMFQNQRNDQAWESSFGRNKNTSNGINIDTGRARSKYEQRIGHTPIGRGLDEKDADTLYKMFDKNRLSSGGNNAIVHQLRNNMWINTSDWERKYGKSLEQIVDDYSKDYERIAEKKNKEKGSNNKATSTIKNALVAATAEPALALESAALGLVSPNGTITKAAQKASESYSKQKSDIKEGVTSKMGNAGKYIYDIGTDVGERVLRDLNPAAPLLNGAITSERVRQELKNRGVEGVGANYYSAGRGLLDAIMTKVAGGLKSTGGNVFTRAAGSFGKQGALGGAEQSIAELLDNVILGDQSTYNSDIRNYMAQGMSQADAESMARENTLIRIGTMAGTRGAIGAITSLGADAAKGIQNKLKDLAYRAYINRYVVNPDDPIFDEPIVNIDDLNEYFYSDNSLPGGDLPRLTGTVDNTQALPGGTLTALPDNIYPIQMPGTNGTINLPGETLPIQLPDLAAKSTPKVMYERATQNAPKVVARLTGKALDTALAKKSSIENKIVALENNIIQYEQDTWRGQVKKAAKTKIKSANKEIKELKSQLKSVDREINGEPTPIIEQLDKIDRSTVNNHKKTLNEIGALAGDEGKQVAKSANTALQNWISTGEKESFNEYARDLMQLHLMNAGNPAYDSLFVDEDGIFGASINSKTPMGKVINSVRALHENMPVVASESAPVSGYKVGDNVTYSDTGFDGMGQLPAVVKEVANDHVLLDVPGLSDHVYLDNDMMDMVSPTSTGASVQESGQPNNVVSLQDFRNNSRMNTTMDVANENLEYELLDAMENTDSINDLLKLQKRADDAQLFGVGDEILEKINSLKERFKYQAGDRVKYDVVTSSGYKQYKGTIREMYPDHAEIDVEGMSDPVNLNLEDMAIMLQPDDSPALQVPTITQGSNPEPSQSNLPVLVNPDSVTNPNRPYSIGIVHGRDGRNRYFIQEKTSDTGTRPIEPGKLYDTEDEARQALLRAEKSIEKGSFTRASDAPGNPVPPLNGLTEHDTSFDNRINPSEPNVNDEAAGYWRRVLGDSEFALQEAQKQGVDVDVLRQAAANNMGYELPTDSVTPPPSNPVPPTPEDGGEDNMRERGMSRHMRGEGAMEMEGVPDEVKEDFINDPDMYKVLSNKSTQEKADYIYNNAEDVEAAFRELLIKKDPAALPLGHQIAKDYSAAGNYDMAAQIYRDMGEKLTEAGQFSQAAVLAMMRDDPMTALHFAQKEISKLNAEGKKRFGDKWKPFELTEDEIDAFNHINPGDTEAIQKVYDQIGQRIGREYPTTFMEKLLEGRKIAMLFNPRTVSRNFLANPPTLAMRWVSDRIEALGQEIVHIIDPSFEKTQAITGSGIKGRKLAKEYLDSEAGQRLLNGTTGKYEVPDIKGAFTKDKQMYKGTVVSKWIDRMTNGGIQRLNESLFDKKGVQSVAETIRNITYGLLELGDNPFVKENFVERLGSYIHAKGIENVEDIPEEAVMLAWEEAMKATYKDDSWAVNMLNKMKKSMESVPVVGRPLSQATIPFVQAPGNISARMVDYSGIRGTKGIADVISGAKKGDADKVRRGIEEISKGLTGMLGIAAGMALYKSGIITGDVAENAKEKAFQQMDGFKSWALHVGDKYFKYDWAQPGAEQLIIGTLLQQAIDNSDEYDSDILRYFGIEGSKAGKVSGALAHGVKSSVNSWFDQSSLQGLMDLMKGNSGQSTDMAQNIVDVGVSDFAGALVPAVGNATAKTLDTTARQTTDPSNTFATFLNQQAAKIPGVSKNLPAKYDVWGEETKYAKSTGEAFLQRFVVPGEYGTESSDPVNKEIRRLFDETADEKAFPFYAAKKVGDKQLNNKEVSEYQKDMGQRSKKMVEKLLNSKQYEAMSDDERVTALYNLYQTSKIITERDVFGKDVPNNSQWKKYVNAYDEAGGGEKGIEAVVNFGEAKTAMKSAGLTASSNLGKEVEKAAATGDTKKVQEITQAAQSVEDLGFTKVGPKETYVKAKNIVPSLTLEEFGKTYKEIDANGNQGISQTEVIDYMNKYHLSPEQGQKTWDMYAPNGKSVPYVKKDGTWGKKKQ